MDEVRATHPYGFRSGQWARILTTLADPDLGMLWLVEFPDGVQDWWRATDSHAGYEHRLTAARH